MNVKQRGRPKKTVPGTLQGLGKTFDRATSYICARLTGGTSQTPDYPEFRESTIKKFYGAEVMDNGINTTAEFWQQNPFKMPNAQSTNFVWFLYEDRGSDVPRLIDSGQFPRAEYQPKEEKLKAVIPNIPISGMGLSDLLGIMQSGNGKENQSIFLQMMLGQMEQNNKQLQSENERLKTELENVKNSFNENRIELERLKLTHDQDIESAKRTVKDELDAKYNEELAQFKEANKKTGLSGLMDDPESLARTVSTFLSELPNMVKGIKETYQQVVPGTQKPEPAQEVRQITYNGVQ